MKLKATAPILNPQPDKLWDEAVERYRQLWEYHHMADDGEREIKRLMKNVKSARKA